MSESAFGLGTSVELNDGRGRIIVDPSGVTIALHDRAHKLAFAEIDMVVRKPQGLWFGTARGIAVLPKRDLSPENLDRVERAVRAAMASALPPERLAEIAANEAAELRQSNTRFTATSVVVGICALVFLASMFLMGGEGSIESKVGLGVISGGLIADGQYYRLLTAGFFHFSVMHIGFNGMALLSLAGLERWMGRHRYLVIYLSSVLTGNIALVWATPESIGGGASTGVFGLLGALVVVHLSWRGARARGMRTSGRGLLVALGVNAVISLLPNVSGAGHFGGLVGGALAAFFVAPTPRSSGRLPDRVIMALAWVMSVTTALALLYGDVYKPLWVPNSVRADAMVVAVAPQTANEIAWTVAIDARATPEELGRAEALARHAFETTRDPNVEDTLAVLLERRGELDDALAHERHALAAQPRSMFVRTLLRFLESAELPVSTGVDASTFAVRAGPGTLRIDSPPLPDGAVLFARSRADLHVVVLPVLAQPTTVEAPALELTVGSTVTLMWVVSGPPLDGEVTRTLPLRGR